MGPALTPLNSLSSPHSSMAPTSLILLNENDSRAGRNKGGWNAAVFVIFVEMAERFAYYGLAANLITYLTNNLHQPMATAAKNVNTWIGVSAVFPLFGAFLADSYLGRFYTILLSSALYFLGMVTLTLSVTVVPVEHRKVVFFSALYVLAMGEGGHKPCVQTFAADQFDEELPEEKAAKSSFFNWWYLGIVFGASTAVLVVIYLQDNVSWGAGFGVLAATLVIALVIFLSGIRRYRKESPAGSPFTRFVQVIVAAARKRRLTHDGATICYDDHDDDVKHRLLTSNQFRFLDKAMMVDKEDARRQRRDPWRLCSSTQVEEAKLLLRLIPIWLTCLIFSATIVQQHTFFTKQAATMVRSLRHFQIPPAALQSLTGFTILISVPIYDRLLVPAARRLTGHPAGITMLRRIGIGLFLSALNMATAALVESKRLKSASEHGLVNNPKATVPMSVWWLLPQYAIGGLADVFTVVGLQELFYDQMPETMRSIGAAAYLSVLGVGSFVSEWIITAVQGITAKQGNDWLADNINQAHLDYFYWVLAGLSAVNLCVYVLVANGFVYKRVGEEVGVKEGKERDTYDA